MASSLTGRQRKRQTSKSVRVIDKASRAVITVGGLGTIVAVLGVCVFLAWVVVPLFTGAEITTSRELDVVASPDATDLGPAVHVSPDEYRVLAWTWHEQGALRLFRLDTGETLDVRRPFENDVPTAVSFPLGTDAVAFAFADGTVRKGTIGFETEYHEPGGAPSGLRNMSPGDRIAHEKGLAQLTPEGQVRIQRLSIELGERLPVSETKVVLLDLVDHSDGSILAAVDDLGRVQVVQLDERRNLLTGRTTTRTESAELPDPGRDDRPHFIVVGGLGDSVLVAWEDGELLRYDTRDPRSASIAERLDVVEPAGARLLALAPFIGRSTVISADSTGRLSAWFRVRPEAGADTADGSALVRAHDLPSGQAPVTALASSTRSRLLLSGDAAGVVRLVHVTSEELLAEAETDDAPIQALAISPKDDGLLAVGPTGAWHWGVELAHPEASLTSLFSPVWYEGYEEPSHVWQSSSGTDDFEMKLGLLPLVIGTLKATLYSMLFGAPIAILAAIYTSEFLQPKAKARIKPSIELMASLPSVVLGFLAALVFAPWVEHRVPSVLAAFFAVPLAMLTGAHLWQLLPGRLAVRWQRYRLWACMATIPIGLAAASVLGPWMEDVLFAGDLKLWLDGQAGTATGGWLLALLPLSGVAVAWGISRILHPAMRARSRHWDRKKSALVDLAKFAGAAVATLVLALLVSATLTALGFDPRGLYLGTYVQRNALVVGFVMGFAIIPIIYTIAEDALTAVPEHLRSASLGCGATPWQTATRIIIPTGMSGLFSALMVGFGRAVGETMIVLMAAGNTPVMNWNIFNGFRTLSANIAVELPEAVRGSTHYRTLFLAALSLFIMTFIVNTGAEAIRLRFRKRAYEA